MYTYSKINNSNSPWLFDLIGMKHYHDTQLE